MSVNIKNFLDAIEDEGRRAMESVIDEVMAKARDNFEALLVKERIRLLQCLQFICTEEAISEKIVLTLRIERKADSQ